MSLVALLCTNLAVVAAAMFGLWLLSLALRDVSIVDIFWGLGFVLIAWVSLACTGAASPRGWLIAVLTSLWGSRLAVYLAWRNMGRPEDYRYRAMRERYGTPLPTRQSVSRVRTAGSRDVVRLTPLAAGNCEQPTAERTRPE